MKRQTAHSRYISAFLLLMALLVSEISCAQYTFRPATTFTFNAYSDTLGYDGISIKNESADSLMLSYQFVSVDTLPGCMFHLCASGECFLEIPSFGSLPPIAPGDTGWLYMHFWTGTVTGTSTAKLYVFQPSDPTNGDTLTYILNNLGLNNLSNSAAGPSVNFYPNPATDFLYVNAPAGHRYSVAIYNTLGARLHYSQQKGQARVPISHLPQGAYLVTFEDEHNRIKTRKLLKLGR